MCTVSAPAPLVTFMREVAGKVKELESMYEEARGKQALLEETFFDAAKSLEVRAEEHIEALRRAEAPGNKREVLSRAR